MGGEEGRVGVGMGGGWGGRRQKPSGEDMGPPVVLRWS